MSESFPLGDVLSVTTGCLVSRDHIGGVYRVLNFMTGDNLFTHQLPRASEEARPSIIAQHPWLDAVEAPEFPDENVEAAVFEWLDAMEAVLGATVDLVPMDPADHTRIDPISEIRMMRPDMPVIVVDLDPS